MNLRVRCVYESDGSMEMEEANDVIIFYYLILIDFYLN